MPKITLTFHAHQPNRLIPYDFFKIGEHAFYEDDDMNARVLNAVSERSYLPANRLMKRLIELSDGQFRMALAISGVILEQAEYHRPDLITSFRELADTGHVEFLAMPYYSSLASIYSPNEFADQVAEHTQFIQRLFGQTPTVLWNTGMLYSNAIAAQAEEMGLSGIMADGNTGAIPNLYTNDLHRAPAVSKTTTLFRNRELSNDLANNRTNPAWSEYPLSPYTFADWLTQQHGQAVNIAMDYETLGERQSDATGVFEFWRTLILAAIEQGNTFVTPGQAVTESEPKAIADCPQNISCSATGDMELWTSNDMQKEAIRKIYNLEGSVKDSMDPDLIHVWRKLQSADHFQYMQKENCFTPYPSPYEGYIYYMNALADLQIRVKREHFVMSIQKGARWV
ncbi:alpha-amylase [Akkermansia glycaniphila]|uniref:glycoside hydrolase family 57 protein n=1 Tax=Akkermansia glycaniphila TaxID=1679444 RepID=UPI001C03543D|nr:glycoside hydrolase family 57 protein [Akkermansia glycaniphila]MBT9449487.1 alpha-amylase [Akkermansia glycaniphila]